MNSFFRHSLLFVLLSSGFCINSQNKIIDSLEKCLTKSSLDTQRVNTLQDLCRRHLFSDSKKALSYGKQALKLSEELNFKKGTAKALHNMGIVYYNTGGYDSALYYFFNSLKIKQTIGDKKGMASSYNNIGAILSFRGDYDKALGYYISSLKINEELKNDEGALSAAINIGNILCDQHNAPGAIKYYRTGLEFALKADNKKGIADAYHNIGNAKRDVNQRDSALIYYKKAQVYYIEGDMKDRIAASYNIIGQWYSDVNQLDTALSYFQRSEKINQSIDNIEGIATTYQLIGKIYLAKKDYTTAERFLMKGLSYTKELGIKEFESIYYENLAELFAKQGNFSKAYQYHILFASLKDSLFSKESLKQVADMNVKYESEKKEQQINILNKDKELNEVNLKKHRLIILFSIAGLLLAILLAIFVLRSLKITRKQKSIIEKQKKLVEEKNQMVEEKNKDIIDSINYAKRIQLALLKEEGHVSEHLPEHFILFKPKDIVSGDFYWTFEKNDYWYLAAADCTGHGVPGAFMSMLGIAFLNEISASNDFLSPAKILDLLREKIVKELGQKGKEGENKDGMDISLICYHTKTKELQWSGANNSLYFFKGNELNEIKANKQPIGFHSAMQPFKNHTISLEKGDSIYLFTDGFVDQFGGAKGKKFKYSKLKELLVSMSSNSMEQQKELLNSEFENWKSAYEQTDDVCMIGVRV